MFEKIDNENKKKIDAIMDNVVKAQAKMSKLKTVLKFDIDMEKYSEISVKVNSYQEFINCNLEQIKLIEANPYKEEDCMQEQNNMQREYNSKFKKIYGDIISQIDRLCKSFDVYGEITEGFIKDRNILNANASKIGCISNVYSGEGIKNEFYSKYKDTIRDLKRIADSNMLK